MRYSTERRHQWLGLALSITLVFGGTIGNSAMAFADDTQELEKIDFVSLNGATEINLYASQGIQHKTIHTSDNKLVIDLKGVNVTKTVRTNFSHARNVDNIIFQPINDHKIRLIIRGENLGKPLIAYKTPSHSQALAFIQPSPVKTQNINNNSNDSLLLEDFGDDFNEDFSDDFNEDFDTKNESIATLATEHSDNFGADMIQPAIFDQEISGAAANIDLSNINDTNKPMNLSDAPKTNESSTSFLGLSMSQIPELPIPLPQAGIILALLVGLGVFIKRKMSAIQKVAPSQPVSGQKQSQAGHKRMSFRELAHQQKHDSESPLESEEQSRELFSPNNHPKKANKWASNPNQEKQKKQQRAKTQNPVGLSALFGSPEPLPRPKRPASNKQAINQYQKQAAPPPPARKRPVSQKRVAPQQPEQKPAPRKPAPKAIKQQNPTTNQANHPLNPPQQAKVKMPQKQRPVQNQATAQNKKTSPSSPSMTDSARKELINKALKQPKPNRNEPLPENTKVLDFLKNVAEMMEQEGDHDKAQQINKGIRRGFNQ